MRQQPIPEDYMSQPNPYYMQMSSESQQMPSQFGYPMQHMSSSGGHMPQIMPMMHPMMHSATSSDQQHPMQYPMYYMPMNSSMMPGAQPIASGDDKNKQHPMVYMQPVFFYPQQFTQSQGSGDSSNTQPMFMPMMHPQFMPHMYGAQQQPKQEEKK